MEQHSIPTRPHKAVFIHQSWYSNVQQHGNLSMHALHPSFCIQKKWAANSLVAAGAS